MQPYHRPRPEGAEQHRRQQEVWSTGDVPRVRAGLVLPVPRSVARGAVVQGIPEGGRAFQIMDEAEAARATERAKVSEVQGA